VPYFSAVPGAGGEWLGAFCTPGDQLARTGFILEVFLPAIKPHLTSPVTEISLTGPHFGDRFGIAGAFVRALEKAETPVLAMNCAVASISAVISEHLLPRAVEGLGEAFVVPAPPPPHRS